MTLSPRWRAALATAAGGAALAAMIGSALPAVADTPVGSPFSDSTVSGSSTWCPTYHGNDGCNNIQLPTSPAFNIQFNPSQVAISRNSFIDLNMTTTNTGAFNSQTQFSEPVGSTIAEKIVFPCTSGGFIAGWPAFWTDGTATGSNFAPGEIDIAEGLANGSGGHVHFGIHYQKSDGTEGSLPTAAQGNIYPGSLCGSPHTYGVIWDSTKVAFYLDGVWQNKVTPAQMGVPMFTDDQSVNDDYGSGSPGGADVFPSTMVIQAFSTTSVGPLAKGTGLKALSALTHAKRGNYTLAG